MVQHGEGAAGYVLDEMEALIARDSAIESLVSFGEELMGLCQRNLKEEGMNLNPSLVLEDLYYRMRRVR